MWGYHHRQVGFWRRGSWTAGIQKLSYLPEPVSSSARWGCHRDTRLSSEGAWASCKSLSLSSPLQNGPDLTGHLNETDET